MKSNYIGNRIYSTKDKEVILAWASFIEQQPWSFFCTFTTSYKLTSNSARVKIQKLYSYLKSEFGINSKFFWVAETFYNGGYHIHCLIQIENNEANKTPIRKAWEKVSGTSSRENCNKCTIENYIKGRGGNFYTVKNLMRNDVDYDII